VINIPIDSDFWTHVYCQYLVEGAVKHTHTHTNNSHQQSSIHYHNNHNIQFLDNTAAANFLAQTSLKFTAPWYTCVSLELHPPTSVLGHFGPQRGLKCLKLFWSWAITTALCTYKKQRILSTRPTAVSRQGSDQRWHS